MTDKTQKNIRFLHASQELQAIDVYFNGTPMISNVSISSISEYFFLTPGSYKVDIFPTGQTTNGYLSQNITIDVEKQYLLSFIGKINHLELHLITIHPDVPFGEAKVRFINLIPEGPPFDLAVKNRDVVFPNLFFKQHTDYLGLTPMTVNLELREAGVKKVVLPLPQCQFKPNQAYSLIIIGKSFKRIKVITIID